MDISSALMSYLKSWYTTSSNKQTKAGVSVTLTFEEFLALFEKRQLASLQTAIDTNRIRYQQDDKNQFAYVLTWRSYAARSTNVLSKDTAIVCSRMKSASLALPQKGDKLRPGHCMKVSKGLIGKAKSEEHAKHISEGKKGQKIAGWSEERKAARSALRKQQEAAKQAAKGV